MMAPSIKPISSLILLCILNMKLSLVDSASTGKYLHDGKCRVTWNAWDDLNDSSNLSTWKGPKCLKLIIGEFQALNNRYSIGDFKRKIEKDIFKLLVEIYSKDSAGSASSSGIGSRLKGNAKTAVKNGLSKAKESVIGASYYVTVDDNYVIFQGETIAYINCKSEYLMYKICQVDGPVTRVLYHAENNASSFCIKPFTFGVTNGLLYVKEGCSAMFTLMYIRGCVHRHSRVQFDRLVCSSVKGNATHKCRVPIGRQISELILIRQISKQHCHRRYGFDRIYKDKIWVEEGCGGEFVYRFSDMFGNPRKQRNVLPNMRLCEPDAKPRGNI